MTEVSILYEVGHDILVTPTKFVIKNIEQKYSTKINLDFVFCNSELFNRLNTNPNYNLLIMHLSNMQESAYKTANHCRSLTNAVLVAESTICPYGQPEVLKHFDEYIGLIIS